MKETSLGTTRTHLYDEFLVLGLSKKWLILNNGKPLEFDAKLVGSKLVLSANLPQQVRTKKGGSNVL